MQDVSSDADIRAWFTELRRQLCEATAPPLPAIASVPVGQPVDFAVSGTADDWRVYPDDWWN